MDGEKTMTKFFKFSIVVDTDMDEFEAWDKFLDIMDECKAKDVFDCEEIEEKKQ